MLRIRLLGGFEVERDGAALAFDVWRRKRAADLLKLLALAPAHLLHREEIIDRLWPDKELWAACIAGAAQQDLYRDDIQAAGFEVLRIVDNPKYSFLSDQARNAVTRWGGKSVSVLARKA